MKKEVKGKVKAKLDYEKLWGKLRSRLKALEELASEDALEELGMQGDDECPNMLRIKFLVGERSGCIDALQAMDNLENE